MASNSGTEFQLFFFLFVPALSLWISIPTECTNCICLSLGAFHRSQWNKKSHFLPENWIKVKVSNQFEKTRLLMLCNKSEFVFIIFMAVHLRAASTISYIVGRCVIFLSWDWSYEFITSMWWLREAKWKRTLKKDSLCYDGRLKVSSIFSKGFSSVGLLVSRSTFLM